MKRTAVCLETIVPDETVIVSHTDLNGIIIYANETFAEISGYEVDELIGKAHNIVRHPDMPSSIFTELWKTIEAGKIWSGYVKNLRQDGGYYWVHAEISRLLDRDNNHIGFKSLRVPISIPKRNELERYYTHLKKEEENLSKLCEWVNTDIIERLYELSENSKRPISVIIEELVNTYEEQSD